MRSNTMFAVITILFLFTLSVHPAIVFNETGEGYEDDGYAVDGGNAADRSYGVSQIETLIILSAGQFIKSHSTFQRFLEKVELSELYGANFNEFRSVLNDAIASMESATANYYELLRVASLTPYNPYVIELLKDFDYDDFQEGKNFNSGIYREVKSFLEKGDITGTYRNMFHKTLSLLCALYAVKYCTDENNFPKIKDLWEVSQMYSDSHFFGQYCTQVFCEVLCK